MFFSPSAPASSVAKCEKLQKEREDLERRFEEQVRQLGGQQQAELRALEERLRAQFQAEAVRLQEGHRAQLLRVRCQHREQVSLGSGLCPAGGTRRWTAEGGGAGALP